jgi:aryl-alcohol dehydrogenase-like predicted oxidoreductase
VNYFDTAVQYGSGESEKTLGRILHRIKPANVAVGTKVRQFCCDAQRCPLVGLSSTGNFA